MDARLLCSLVVVASCLGCANVHVNRATLIASTAAIALDGVQTYQAAAGGWSHGGCNGGAGPQYEANPIMGSHPTPATVISYFGLAVIANAVLWVAMPERYRSVIPVGIVAMQGYTIVGNIAERDRCP